MAETQKTPRVYLATIKKYTSRNGTEYLFGFLGASKLVAFESPTEPGKWNLYLQEKTEEERNADREKRGTSDRQDYAAPPEAAKPSKAPSRAVLDDDIPF